MVFSGGQTRDEAGPRSEAGSYYECGVLLGCITEANKRLITTEEHARDSLENVAFSLARFEQMTGSAPESVVVRCCHHTLSTCLTRRQVVGWGFKRERFEMHCKAVGFDVDHVAYVGVGIPGDADAAARGERATVDAFAADPYAASGSLLAKKRSRNPFHRMHPYTSHWTQHIVW